MPRSAPLFIGSLLGLPTAALEQLDLNLPVLGSISDGGTSTSAVIAVHVKDGDKVADLVCDGKPARCTKKSDPASGVTLLEPPPNEGMAPPFAMGVSGNYLCVASDREALAKLAPFVTRTLPTRPLPREAATLTVPRAALAGPIASQLRRFWASFKKEREADDVAMRAKHGGSAPDFGDPTEALADIDTKMTSFLSLVGDLEEARITVAVEGVPPTVRLQVTMTPVAGGGPATQELAAMSPGGAEPLLALPSSSMFALFTRDAADMRVRSAKEQADAIGRVLGGRLAATDKAKIDEALRNWSSGRGEWLTLGVLPATGGRAAVVRTSASNPNLLGRSAGQLLSLLSIPAISEPLSNWVGELRLSPASTATGSRGNHSPACTWCVGLLSCSFVKGARTPPTTTPSTWSGRSIRPTAYSAPREPTPSGFTRRSSPQGRPRPWATILGSRRPSSGSERASLSWCSSMPSSSGPACRPPHREAPARRSSSPTARPPPAMPKHRATRAGSGWTSPRFWSRSTPRGGLPRGRLTLPPPDPIVGPPCPAPATTKSPF